MSDEATRFTNYLLYSRDMFIMYMSFVGNKWFLAGVILSQLPWIFFLTYYNQADDHFKCCSDTNLAPDSKLCWNEDIVGNNSECLDRLLFWNPPRQDHEGLIQLVRDKYIFSPDFSTPYNLSSDAENNWDRSETGQVPVVRDFLQNQTKGPGFFIEVGAHDGEYLTNTLWFERALGWNGLLIEAEPLTFQKLKSKHRRAWITNTCLSPSVYPEKLSFYLNAKTPGIGIDSLVQGAAEHGGATEEVKTKCFPLFTLLAAINVFHVDFFSLDIEGAEIQVLKTIPFDKISFKVLLIEVNEHMTDKGVGLHKLMKEVGYTFYKQLTFDHMYVHSSFVPKDFIEPKI